MNAMIAACKLISAIAARGLRLGDFPFSSVFQPSRSASLIRTKYMCHSKYRLRSAKTKTNAPKPINADLNVQTIAENPAPSGWRLLVFFTPENCSGLLENADKTAILAY
jgi:hypothetical protein